MTRATEPVRTLHFSDDLTADDVAAVEAFLRPRLDEQIRAHDFESEEHRTAAGLDAAVRDLIAMLQVNIGAQAKYTADGTDEPREWVLRRRQEIKNDWNRLWSLTAPWRQCDGYDLARWHPLAYFSAEHQAQREASDAEGAAR